MNDLDLDELAGDCYELLFERYTHIFVVDASERLQLLLDPDNDLSIDPVRIVEDCATSFHVDTKALLSTIRTLNPDSIARYVEELYQDVFEPESAFIFNLTIDDALEVITRLGESPEKSLIIQIGPLTTRPEGASFIWLPPMEPEAQLKLLHQELSPARSPIVPEPGKPI